MRRRLDLGSVPIIALALLGFGPSALARDDPPGEYASIARDDLIARVPNFFSYDDPFAAKPGRRIWLRVDDRHFIERHPDGGEVRFRIVGHAVIRGIGGTVVAKLGEGPGVRPFRMFIPDKGNSAMVILVDQARDGPPDWLSPGWSRGKRIVLDKVE